MAGRDVFLTLQLFKCIQCHKNEKRFTLACSIQRESQQRCSLGAIKSYLGVWNLCSGVEDVVWDQHSRHAHQQWDEGRRLMPRPLHRHFPSSSPASHPSPCCFFLLGKLRRTTMVQVIDGRSVRNGHQLPYMNAALVSCCPNASKQRYYALRLSPTQRASRSAKGH